MLLYQLLEKNNVVSDRLYRALYAVLLSPSLPKSTKVHLSIYSNLYDINLNESDLERIAFHTSSDNNKSSFNS